MDLAARFRLGFAVLGFFWATGATAPIPAQACMGPHERVFPVCSIPAPRDAERTTVIYVHSGKALASASLGGDAVVTEIVDVQIAPADKPHKIVLSSGKAIIWRFFGRVDLVSQVIALGSQYEGSKVIGIIGIPQDRIIFPDTDENALKTVLQTSCTSIYAACEASAYFNVPKAARMELAGPSPASRFHADQFVEMPKAGTIRIPEDGWIEAEKESSVPEGAEGWVWPTGAAPGRYEPYAGTGYNETSQSYERGVIQIDPATVISPVEIKPYGMMPGRTGLEQLISLGALIKAGDPRFRTVYDEWNLKSSEPYRSRLDPDFLFSRRVDYLIVRPTALPAAMHRTTFLVAEGVAPPDLLRGQFTACLYFVNAPTPPSNSAGFEYSRCDGTLAAGPSERERALAAAIRVLGSMRSAGNAQKEACRLLDIDAGSWFAGVALSEGEAYRPAAVDKSERHIDLLIKRPGKVALYLEMDSGRTNWHVLPSPQTEITNIILGEFATQNWMRIDGVPSSVAIRPFLDNRSSADCYAFNPGRDAHLGGPAIQSLNAGLHVLTGRELDSITRETNDGSWPAVSPIADAPRVTLVIE
jgi:hypothetical protein